MISFIRGKVAQKGANFAVVDVGGIGLKLLLPARDAENAKKGEEAFFNTYFSVREDAMELFGFSSEEDLLMFNLLLGVSGVGPKAALSLLSAFTASSLSSAVMLSDAKKIATAQGIGAKTAQRIILELADKVPSFGSESAPEEAADPTAGSEAVSALIALGYSAGEAADAVKRAGTKESVEATVKAALIALMR